MSDGPGGDSFIKYNGHLLNSCIQSGCGAKTPAIFPKSDRLAQAAVYSFEWFRRTALDSAEKAADPARAGAAWRKCLLFFS